MRESINAVAMLVACVSTLVAVVFWFEDQPTQATWLWRIGSSVVVLAAVAVLLKMHVWAKPDLVPDFLGQEAKNIFERNGLCFAFSSSCEDGVFFVHAMFQNRFNCPCKARIAMRPVVGVHRSAVTPFQRPFQNFVFDIACDPGAFGIASIPLPVHRDQQGKKLTLQIGASVEYPPNKGKALRFNNGFPIRYDADFRRNAFWRTLKVVSMISLVYVHGHHFPPTVTFELPIGVAETVPPEITQSTCIRWTVGDNSLAT